MEKRTLQNRLTTKSTSQVKSKLLVIAFKLTWKSGQKEQEKLDKDEHFSRTQSLISKCTCIWLESILKYLTNPKSP